MRNNHSPPLPVLKQTNLIYEFTCKHGDCELLPSSYIGLTTTTLSRRLAMHLAGGAPKKHMQEALGIKLTREIIVTKTKIIKKENDIRKLDIIEATLIQKKDSSITKQDSGRLRTLKLH